MVWMVDDCGLWSCAADAIGKAMIHTTDGWTNGMFQGREIKLIRPGFSPNGESQAGPKRYGAGQVIYF
jgi:hypothetical protein